jgi:flavodoxin
MKILIAYYSRTKHTEELALAIKKELEKRKHSVHVEKIKPKKEHSFWGWFFIRFFKGECEIEEPKIKDVSEYDVICIGSPNWTRLSLPMRRYLKIVSGLENKPVGFFSTTWGPPVFEWYFISAFLFDWSTSVAIRKKRGILKERILLSSFFKRWSLVSNYGKKKIKQFIKHIERPIPSLKKFILKQEEVEHCRLIFILLSFLFLIFLVLKHFLSPISEVFSTITLISFLNFFLFINCFLKNEGYKIIKYFSVFSFVLIWTLICFSLQLPSMINLFYLGLKISLGGYIVILVLLLSFKDEKLILHSGITSILFYLFLVYSFHQKILIFLPEIIFLGFLVLFFSTIAFSYKREHLKSLILQENLIETISTLEIRVRAKTKALEELVTRQEEIIEERTKELRKRIEQLEKFQKITVGREIKMMELKEKIKELKEKLKNKDSST